MEAFWCRGEEEEGKRKVRPHGKRAAGFQGLGKRPYIRQEHLLEGSSKSHASVVAVVAWAGRRNRGEITKGH